MLRGIHWAFLLGLGAVFTGSAGISTTAADASTPSVVDFKALMLRI
jgi:hypothetical protein